MHWYQETGVMGRASKSRQKSIASLFVEKYFWGTFFMAPADQETFEGR